MFYIQQLKNNKRQIIGYSNIKKCEKSKDIPKDGIKLNMNNSQYDEFIKNPKDFYLSGNTLVKLER